VECAWTTIGVDPVMMQRYEELKKRITAKRAIIIIARKLLSRIYYVLKNQKPYELGVIKKIQTNTENKMLSNQKVTQDHLTFIESRSLLL
jgi:hypothetical protein